jgi:ABC-type antimicrobial peptide transport system permease subunit
MREAWRRFSRNRGAVLGLVILIVLILVAALAPLLYPHSPWQMVSRPFLGPFADAQVPFGTDMLGRDIAAGIAQTPWLPVAGNAMRLGVGLFIVPLGFIANPALLQIAETPVAALLAMAKIAIGLWLISFAVIGAARRPWVEAARIAALPVGLAVIFL